jgi:hypothetical protein
MIITKVVLAFAASAVLATGGFVSVLTRPLSPQEAVEKAAVCLGIDQQVATKLRTDLSHKDNPGVLHIHNGTEIYPTRFSCGTSSVIPLTNTPVGRDPVALVDVAVHYMDSPDVDHAYVLAIQGDPGPDGSPGFLFIAAAGDPFRPY